MIFYRKDNKNYLIKINNKNKIDDEKRRELCGKIQFIKYNKTELIVNKQEYFSLNHKKFQLIQNYENDTNFIFNDDLICNLTELNSKKNSFFYFLIIWKKVEN